MKKSNHKNIVLSSLFLALGVVLPLFTAQIKEIGDTLLPMHIPVMLCGFLCGSVYGGVVGLILPFFRSLIFSMPPIYPNAVWMALELATYGFMTGFLYSRIKTKSISRLYICLILSMLCGRVVWGVAKAILLGVGGKQFTLMAFFTGGVLDALPGIALQLVLIPLIVKIVERQKRKEL